MIHWLRIGRAALGIGVAFVLVSCGVPGDAGSDAGPRSEQSASTAAQSASGETAGAELAAKVSQQDLVAALAQIETLTLDASGSRGPGSAGYPATAGWIENQLVATGFYDVYRQDFTIQIPHPGDSQLTDAGGRVINQAPLGFSPGTPDEGITGVLVAATDGHGCRAADWPSEVAGQIGIAERGGCSFADMNWAASQAGAAMMIVTNDRSGGLYGTLGGLRDGFIPATGVTSSEGNRLRTAMAAGEVQLSFTFAQNIESHPTYNLFAETRSGDAGNVVMAGAHLDSVPEGPGINDNGSGSAILLTTALQMASGQPPVNKVRYAWWSGEELGLLGSAHLVNTMVDSDPQTIQQIAAYLNVDMVASPNGVIGVYDGDGSDFPDETLPAGSGEVEQLFTGRFDSLAQPWVPIEMGGSSDHASFINSGVPTGGLFTGAGDLKTHDEQAVFGGTAGQPYDPNYHQAADGLANVNQDFLGINGKASAYAIGHLAWDTSIVNGSGSGNSGVPAKASSFGYAAAV